MSLSLSRSEYGTLPDGDVVYEYTLSNASHVTVKLITRGCTITSVVTPSSTSSLNDVVLGFPSLSSWLQHGSNFNSIVGRYANRIKAGTFTLDGRRYALATNNGPNHLHGGPTGFYSRNFKEQRQIVDSDRVGVALTYTSADGEEGYPGALQVTATFTLTARSAFVMDFAATTSAPTIVNLCNHSYWNLSGDYARDVLGHRLQLSSSACTPIDATMIPTGELQPTKGTHHDFTQLTPIGARLSAFDSVDPGANGGYDHNYVIDPHAASPSGGRKDHVDAPGQLHAATLVDDASGRVMDVYTTAPGVQVYTGNFLNGSVVGKEGRPYAKHAGVCLETQVFPNSPNQESFPNCVLRPGETYRHVVTHVFSTTNSTASK